MHLFKATKNLKAVDDLKDSRIISECLGIQLGDMMAAAPEHFRYADALISAGINAFAKKGKAAKKRDMVAGATGAARSSINATIRKDKKLRPSAPKAWNTATAVEVNKKIENTVWSEVKKAYSKALRDKADLQLPNGDLTTMMTASLMGVGLHKSGAGDHISRRSFTTGLFALTGATFYFGGVADASAANKSLVSGVNRDVRSYVKGKFNQIVDRMKKAIN